MSAQTNRYSRYFTYIQPVLRMPIVKTYGSIIFTIFALTIFIIFAIKPTIETILVLQKQDSNQKETLAKITKKSKDLSKAKENYKNIDPAIKAKIQAEIPRSADVSTVITALEGAVKEAGASISAVQFQPITIEKPLTSAKNQKLTEVQFTYNIEGEYSQLRSVLERLKVSPRLINIDNLTFSKIGGEDNLTKSANLLMSVTGKAYYLK